MSAYEKVLLARAKDRPTGLSYIENIFEDFIELHGDRRFADDPAIVGGIATLKGQPVTVIAIDKGKDMRERVKRNFGSPNPEGYRKALRLMRQAEKFHRPVELLRLAHQAQRLAVALWVGRAEVALHPLPHVLALVNGDDGDGLALQGGDAPHNGRVVGKTPVPVELDKVLKDVLDVREPRGPVLGPGQQDFFIGAHCAAPFLWSFNSLAMASLCWVRGTIKSTKPCSKRNSAF